MIWVILSIICTLSIFVLFKIIDKTNTPLINSIVINYFFASVLGFYISSPFQISNIINSDWIYAALTIGFFFITGFYVLGKSSEKVGISITTVISKMAVVIPIIFSIIAYKEEINSLKILAIIFTIIAIIMCVYKKSQATHKVSLKEAIIPILLFFIMGTVDASIIYSKENYIDDSLTPIFTSSIFAIACLLGLLSTLFNLKTIRGYTNYKSWLWGGILGLTNFGSVYFIFKSLNASLFTNSILYGIINISVVTLSLFVGLTFFKEKLTRINLTGAILAIFTVILLTYIKM